MADTGGHRPDPGRLRRRHGSLGRKRGGNINIAGIAACQGVPDRAADDPGPAAGAFNGGEHTREAGFSKARRTGE